ncbi:vegetative cell wall protein gp1-like [Siniperca chuatsi]|uniref:vegetative cell wall protein gp1-like n=1 Tax=Siniperca chuatsi TaxID=119488 RepID=UPI001CE13354|nr:vegetative cell wall protein gp1-like [Siniperca chuatsi]
MENAVRYVRSRDRQRAAAAATATTTAAAAVPTSSTTTTTTAAATGSSTASVSAASQGAGSASQFAAFVSGRRSLSAVEMQAKIKKPVLPKPASPASFRPAPPSTPSEEPSDEELVRAAVDVEQSPDVQPPLSLLQHPPPATTSAAPQKGAGVSAVLDEPTDEELLEDTLERDHPLRPPAALVKVQPAEPPAPSLQLPPPAPAPEE